MHATSQMLKTQATAFEVVDSCAFTGEGVELYGCYASSQPDALTGTGSELFGCYKARDTVQASRGDGAELFGCYKA